MASTELYEIAMRAEELRASSVIFFPFSLTFLLTSGYMVLHRLVVKDQSILKLVFVSSFFFYVANVVRLVFFPLPINREYHELVRLLIDGGVRGEARHNLFFFDFMKWDNLWHWTTVGNFFLLFPLGFYLPLMFKKHPWNIFKVIFSGFMVSLSIELAQFAYSLYVGYVFRSFDVDDLLFNTLGVLAAYLLFLFLRLFYWLFQKIRKVFRRI